MKHYTTLLIAVIILLLSGCERENENPKYAPVANFSAFVKQPLKVVISNNSTNADSYLWDFGDGTTSREEQPTHKYKSKGAYKITLVASNKRGYTNSYSCNVTVKEPTELYISGYRFNNVSTENKYYNLTVTGCEYITTTYLSTNWVMLSNPTLPYSGSASNVLKYWNESSYIYTASVYYSEKESGANKKTAMSGTFNYTLLKTFPEEFSCAANGTDITLYFTWK